MYWLCIFPLCPFIFFEIYFNEFLDFVVVQRCYFKKMMVYLQGEGVKWGSTKEHNLLGSSIKCHKPTCHGKPLIIMFCICCCWAQKQVDGLDACICLQKSSWEGTWSPLNWDLEWAKIREFLFFLKTQLWV